MKTKFAYTLTMILLGIALTMVCGFSARVANARVCVAGSSAACPIRISLLRGTYGTTVHGRLTVAPQQKYYALRMRAGQRLTAAKKRAIAERMRKYWAAKRALMKKKASGRR